MSIRNFLRHFVASQPDYEAANKLANQLWFKKAVLKVVDLPHKLLDEVVPDDEIESLVRTKQALLEEDKSKLR